MIGDRFDTSLVAPGLLHSITRQLQPKVAGNQRLAIAVGGESGSGKSTLAFALANHLAAQNLPTGVLQMDDYFRYPPQTNDRRRREDLQRVGPAEVDLTQLDAHIQAFQGGALQLTKPLVDYQNDAIGTETIALEPTRVLIVEGTYALLVDSADIKIFMDYTYQETRAARLARGRDNQDEVIENILSIEHRIVAAHRSKAHLVVRDNRVQ